VQDKSGWWLLPADRFCLIWPEQTLASPVRC